MKLVLTAVALICTTAVIVPASAVSLPRSYNPASLVGIAQQKPPSKPTSEKQRGERCFGRCWHSCWGFHCVERCRCRCTDEKPDYCAKLIWGLRVFR
jgi:hypothetical protein